MKLRKLKISYVLVAAYLLYFSFVYFLVASAWKQSSSGAFFLRGIGEGLAQVISLLPALILTSWFYKHLTGLDPIIDNKVLVIITVLANVVILYVLGRGLDGFLERRRKVRKDK